MMKKKRQGSMIYALGLLIGILLHSCGFEDLEPSETQHRIRLNPAINLGRDTLNIIELIEDFGNEELEFINEVDQVIVLKFSDQVIFNDNDQILTLETVNNSTSIGGISGSGGASGVELPFDQSRQFTFTANEASRIDSVYYSGGTLSVSIDSNFPAPIENLSWSLPQTVFTNTGAAIGETQNLPARGNDVFTAQLSDLKTLFSQQGGSNRFDMEIVGTLDVPAGVTIVPSDNLSVAIDFLDPEVDRIYGLFNQKEINVDDISFGLGDIEDLRSSNLTFGAPSMTLRTVNGYGSDLLIGFDEVFGVLEDGSIFEMTNMIDASDRLIRTAVDIQTPTTSDIVLNSDNSNIDELLNANPTRLELPLSVQVNPNVNGDTQNFMSRDSEIQVEAIFEIPLIATLDDYEIDFDFDLSDQEDIEDAKNLTLKISYINSLPIEFTLGINVIDNNGQVLSELVEQSEIETPIESPEIGDDGRVIAPRTSEIAVSLDEQDIDELVRADKLQVVLSVSSLGQSVSFFPDGEIILSVGATGEFDLEL